MPAYNFQKQFAPYVKDGSKPHTLRAYRIDGQLPKPGQLAHLYTGMRTPKCEKLIDPSPEILTVITVFIFPNGDFYTTALMDAEEAELYLHFPDRLDEIESSKITHFMKNSIAWEDGFRPPGSSFSQPGEAFELMKSWVSKTHILPFAGTLIRWAL